MEGRFSEPVRRIWRAACATIPASPTASSHRELWRLMPGIGVGRRPRRSPRPSRGRRRPIGPGSTGLRPRRPRESWRLRGPPGALPPHGVPPRGGSVRTTGPESCAGWPWPGRRRHGGAGRRARPQPASGGLRQGLGDDSQPLVNGTLHLRVVPHDLREGQEPAALGLDGLGTGGQQDAKVLQEASGAVDEGLDDRGRRGLQADDEEVGLGGEVVEDGAPGDSGEGGDIIDCHRGVTALPGQSERGGADGGAGALRLGGAQVGSGHTPILHPVQLCTQCTFARGSSRRQRLVRPTPPATANRPPTLHKQAIRDTLRLKVSPKTQT